MKPIPYGRQEITEEDIKASLEFAADREHRLVASLQDATQTVGDL